MVASHVACVRPGANRGGAEKRRIEYLIVIIPSIRPSGIVQQVILLHRALMVMHIVYINV